MKVNSQNKESNIIFDKKDKINDVLICEYAPEEEYDQTKVKHFKIKIGVIYQYHPLIIVSINDMTENFNIYLEKQNLKSNERI